MPHVNSRQTPYRTLVYRWSCLCIAVGIATLASSTCWAMISVGPLTKEQAQERYGLTMHARSNGDAGILVWLEFKKKGWLEKFTYAQLEITDAHGKHLVSAMLQPNPIYHQQAKDVTTVAFSAEASQLPNCHFLVVCYQSSEGDVGYTLAVKDFLDLNNPVTEE